MSDIFSKSEKLASALYLITGFFSEQEPMKWKLRTLSGDLVSLSLSLTSQAFKEREAARLETRILVEELMSLLSVSKNAGLVSEPNESLLRQELTRYLDLLGFPKGLGEENGLPILSRNFFVSETKELGPRPEIEPSDIKDKTSEGAFSYLPPLPEKKDIERPLKEFGAVSVKKNSRQSIIIGLLKRKKEIMIKDVAPLIAGVSEKTIQRELLAMVQAGILRKTGEKRWSRYSLA